MCFSIVLKIVREEHARYVYSSICYLYRRTYV